MINKEYTSQGIISNTFFSISSKLVPILISLICIPIIINGLGEEKYGAFTIALVFIGYFNLFDLGLGRAITKLISERIGKSKQQEIADIFKTGVTLTFILGVTGGIIFFFISEPITIRYLNPPIELIGELLSGLMYLSIGIPFAVAINSYKGLLEALHEFKVITIVQIVFGFVTYFGIILLLEYTNDLSIIIAYLSTIKVIHFLIFRSVSNSKLNVPDLRSEFNKKYIKELFSFGGWVTVSMIVSPIMTALDRLVVASKEGMQGVAYYSTASEITQRVGVLPSAVVSVLFPVFSRNQNFKEDQNAKLYKASFNLMILASGIFALLFISFGKEFLTVWIGEAFAENSFIALQIITIGTVFNFLARIPFSFIQGTGRPDITAKFHMAELPVFLILLFLLTEKFGIAGAAWATSIRMILDFILLHIYSIRSFCVSTSLMAIMFGAFLPIGVAFYISMAELDLVMKSLSVLGVTLFMIAVSWYFIFDEYLRDKLSQSIKSK